MQSTINLPKSFAEHCLVNKRHSQAKTFVYLKMICSGKIRLNNDVVNLACKRLSISRGTFYRHLNDLKRWDWIGYSQQSRIYFIRGFKRICELENLEGKTCAVFSSEWFKTFKAFLSGSVIGYLVKQQKKAERKKRRSSQLKPVATKAISKIMNIPESSAYTLKQIATKAKFIYKERDYFKTGIHPMYRAWFKTSNPELSHKVVVFDNQLCICKPDLVKGLLKYKTNRHLG